MKNDVFKLSILFVGDELLNNISFFTSSSSVRSVFYRWGLVTIWRGYLVGEVLVMMLELYLSFFSSWKEQDHQCWTGKLVAIIMI